MIPGENLRQSGRDFLRSNKYGGHESSFYNGDDVNGECISFNNHKTIVNIKHPIIYQAFVIKNNNVFFDSSYLSLSLVLNCAYLYGIVTTYGLYTRGRTVLHSEVIVHLGICKEMPL